MCLVGGGNGNGASARPRVLVLIKGLGVGGAERLVVDLVTGPGRVDYELACVLGTQQALAPELEAAGVPVHRLGATGSVDLRWTLALRRVLMAERFDVLHAHLPYAAAFGRLVARSLPPQRRPRLVYTEHSLWSKAAVLTRFANRATVGLDDALFVVSEPARAALPARLRPGAQVVVHGVDQRRTGALLDQGAALRSSVRHELGVADDEVLALTVANLRAEKGHDVLLEAARRLAASHLRLRFVVVGGGPLADQVAARRDELGLAGRLDLLGHRDDAMRLMAGADLFVLPSHQEGLPVALMEAMSMGLPVVATDVGGVRTIVTDQVEGLVVAPGRPGELAEAVARLAEDAPLRSALGVAARRASTAFDIATARRLLEDRYLALTGGRAT